MDVARDCPTDAALHAWLIRPNDATSRDVGTHLKTCDRCRARLTSLPASAAAAAQVVAASLPASETTVHIGENALVSLVLESTPLPEDSAAHLAVCRECRESLDDLVAFAGRRASAPATPSIPFAHTPKTTWRWAAGIAALTAAALALFALRDRPASDRVPAPSPPVATAMPAETAPVASLVDRGGQIALYADGRVSGAVPAHLTAAVASALRGQPLPGVARVTVLRPPTPAPLGAGPAPMPLSLNAPIGTRVRTATPLFSWTTTVPGEAYQVRVFDERYIEVATSPTVRTRSWTPTSPLPSGRVLTWQLSATGAAGQRVAPGPDAAEARFEILTDAARRDIEQRLEECGEGLIPRLLVLSEAGLLAEAAETLDSIEALNPGAPLVAGWRASLRR